jgi:hypothetical protein
MAVPLPTPVLPTRHAFAGYQERAWVGRLLPIGVVERLASEKPTRSDLRPVFQAAFLARLVTGLGLLPCEAG